MAHVVYTILEHDGGWAYRVGDTISEPFPSRDAAQRAASRAAMEQQRPGETASISWEDERGRWHDEISEGSDRPEVQVED